jgi:hypothetical protein
MNIHKMSEDELKATLKERALAERIDLTDPKNRHTIWSENGIWSEKADHIHYEGSAANVMEKQRKAGECMLKSSYSRTMILDAALDRIEIVLPDGNVTFAVPR